MSFQHGGQVRLSGTARALIALAAAGGILVALVMTAGIVVTIAALASRSNPTPSDPATNAARVQCQPVEQLANHFHARLTIVEAGNAVTVPANVGIQSSCIYWLHTHDTSGVIHVETPLSEFATTFTLGDFFSVWREPIDASHAGPASVGAGESMRVWVQAGPSDDAKQWSRNPATIPLHDCESISIDIGSGAAGPPAYDFPTGFGCGA